MWRASSFEQFFVELGGADLITVARFQSSVGLAQVFGSDGPCVAPLLHDGPRCRSTTVSATDRCDTNTSVTLRTCLDEFTDKYLGDARHDNHTRQAHCGA